MRNFIGKVLWYARRSLNLLRKFIESSAVFFENWVLFRLLKAIEPLAVLIAITVFLIDVSDRQEDRIRDALQTVHAQTSGEGMKATALETLNRDSGWFRWLPFAYARRDLSEINVNKEHGLEKDAADGNAGQQEEVEQCKNTVILEKVNLRDASLEGAKFICTVLTNADFRDANLKRAEFSHSYLTGINWEGADISDAKFDGVEYLDCEELEKANNYNQAITDCK